MKKILALTLVAMLALASLAGFAEETQMSVFDFDDFTLELPNDIMGMTYDKEENSMFLILYPNYEAEKTLNANFNVVWSTEYIDIPKLTEDDYTDCWEALQKTLPAQYEAAGITLNELTLDHCKAAVVAGKDAISMSYSAIVDYAAVGIDIETKVMYQQYMVCDEEFGMYTFTITYYTPEDMDAFTPIMDSLVWVS